MLFLRALLFSLLGTSALANPVPFTHTAGEIGMEGAVVRDLGLAKNDPNRLNGLWREIEPVSEHRSFYLTRY